MVDWDEGMGELYYTNDGCLFSVPDAGSCGRKSTGFVGEWVVVYMYTLQGRVYPSVHLGKQD